MRVLVALLLAATLAVCETGVALSEDWSDLNREQTIERLSEALAEINQPFHVGTQMMTKSWMEETLELAIQQMAALKDAIEGNPWVTMNSFTVGFPWGVSVELAFKEGDQQAAE